MHYKRILQNAVVCTAVAAVISTSSVPVADAASRQGSTNESQIMLNDDADGDNSTKVTESWTSGNTTITLEDDKLVVTVNPDTDGAMSDDGIDWSSIADKVKYIEVGSGVTHIGQNAFKGLTSLGNTTVTYTVTVGESTFAYTYNLTIAK